MELVGNIRDSSWKYGCNWLVNKTSQLPKRVVWAVTPMITAINCHHLSNLLQLKTVQSLLAIFDSQVSVRGFFIVK